MLELHVGQLLPIMVGMPRCLDARTPTSSLDTCVPRLVYFYLDACLAKSCLRHALVQSCLDVAFQHVRLQHGWLGTLRVVRIIAFHDSLQSVSSLDVPKHVQMLVYSESSFPHTCLHNAGCLLRGCFLLCTFPYLLRLALMFEFQNCLLPIVF